MSKITKCRIKICGITNENDAFFAAEAGANLLGFNFYKPSPRYVSPERAAAIVSRLPNGVESVGVFVNEEIESVLEIATAVGLSVLQFHGDETAEYVKTVKASTGLRTIQAFHVGPQFEPAEAELSVADAIVLDTFSGNLYGGSGETFDPASAILVKKLVKRLYVAGGLTPTNVAEIITRVEPYGVDVCSGVEKVKGRKDRAKVLEFIRNINDV